MQKNTSEANIMIIIEILRFIVACWLMYIGIRYLISFVYYRFTGKRLDD